MHLPLALSLAFATSPVRAFAQPTEELETAVQKHLNLFLTVPERRESGEGITLDDHGELEIRLLRTLPPERRRGILCQGVRWLLLGRLQRADGIGGLFSALPDVTGVALVFYELETTLKVDARGEYSQVRHATPRARIRVSRERGEGLDRAAVDRMLGPDTCLENGEKLVDAIWAP